MNRTGVPEDVLQAVARAQGEACAAWEGVGARDVEAILLDLAERGFIISGPAENWERFIEHLNATQPLGRPGENLPHKNFLGSSAKYRKVFMEANS